MTVDLLGVNNIPKNLKFELPNANVIWPKEKNNKMISETKIPALYRFLNIRANTKYNNKEQGITINNGINILVIDTHFRLHENKKSIGKTAKSIGCKKDDFISFNPSSPSDIIFCRCRQFP